MILFGESTTDESSEIEEAQINRVNSSNIILAYICLFGEPISGAIGQILMRLLRNLKHPMTVGTYTNFSAIPVTIGLSLLFGQNLLIF